MLSLAFVPYYCKFIQSCWLGLRHLFLYISSVLDCNLLCFIVNKNDFQSNLNPKEFCFIFSSSFLAFLFYTDWKYPLYVAFNSNLIAGMFIYCFSMTWSVQCVCESHTNQNGTERKYVGEFFVLFCCFLYFLCYSHLFLFLFSQKGVECAIPHTAIYAGQELWHFIFCLWHL